MTDLSVFQPLYSALTAALAMTRRLTGEPVNGEPLIPVTGGQAMAAQRALMELVPYERSLAKMFEGVRTGQLNRYRWAGHHFVEHIILEYVLAGATADSKSPVWDLPLTADLVTLVLEDESSASEDAPPLKTVLPKEHQDVLLVTAGVTVRQLADDFRVKKLAAHRARIAMRKEALERAKQVLSAEDLELLTDKTLY